jgi:transglutaminase-like putative cysteine protease
VAIEANWDELFAHNGAAAATDGDAPPLGRFGDDAITLALAAVLFLCVAVDVQNADWVDGLPSLLPVGVLALLAGYAFARVRVTQLLLLPLGLLAGAALVYAEIMALLPGPTLYVRTDHMLDRMYVWWSAVTQRGTSLDPLPVIIIMLVMAWMGAFLAAWAIFRWRNPFLGLIPGAAALIWDSGFSTSEFSPTSVLYVLFGVLLVMRFRVAGEQRRWTRDGVAHPRFLALSVIHATFWATCGLLVAAWVLPLGMQSNAANARWSAITSPFTDHLGPVARAFMSINPDKGVKVHALRDALLLQGGIDPAAIPAAQVQADLPPDVAPFLRDQSFEQYRRGGWQLNEQSDAPVPAGAPVAGDDAIDPLARKSVAATVKVQGGNGDRLLSIGQPLRPDRASQASTGADPADVSRLESDGHLRNGTEYTVVGSVSAATVDQLRAAGTQYPDWVTQNYLQVSRRVPARVGDKARDVTAATTNPYDAATAIESFLRDYPVDYNVQPAPDGHDPVDYFLFDAKRGYFDYHASAMTVMLRTVGIPARLASGYVIDPDRETGSGAYKLTQQQAFAWPEVYFPTIGWVEFNPTPSQPTVPRPAEPQTAPAPEPPLTVSSSDGGAGYLTLRSLPDVSGAMSAAPWRAIGVTALIAAVAAFVLTVIASVVAWEFTLRGLSPSSKLWEKTVRLASLTDAPRRPHETPRAYADRLAQAIPAASGAVAIAASYERDRFGRKPLSAAEATTLREAWHATRNALLRRALRLGRPTRTVTAAPDEPEPA